MMANKDENGNKMVHQKHHIINCIVMVVLLIAVFSCNTPNESHKGKLNESVEHKGIREFMGNYKRTFVIKTSYDLDTFLYQNNHNMEGPVLSDTVLVKYLKLSATRHRKTDGEVFPVAKAKLNDSLWLFITRFEQIHTSAYRDTLILTADIVSISGRHYYSGDVALNNVNARFPTCVMDGQVSISATGISIQTRELYFNPEKINTDSIMYLNMTSYPGYQKTVRKEMKFSQPQKVASSESVSAVALDYQVQDAFRFMKLKVLSIDTQ